MRVCHLVRQYHPNVGGLESFVSGLSHALSELGCSCEVLTLDRLFTRPSEKLASEEVVDGVSIRRAPFIGHRRLFAPLLPHDRLRDYDVLHVHGIDGLFERVAREPRRRGQIRIATSHGLFFHTPWLTPLKRAYFSSITRWAAQRYDALIANSQSDVDHLRGIGAGAVLIPNGVAPLGDFICEGRDLLYLGRLASHKHIDRLLAVLAQAPLEGVRLHIVGEEWDVTRNALANRAEALGISDRVLFHGRLDGERLHAVLRECSVFVSASTYEGFGMSLIEAMSVGLIPVVENNLSFAELLAQAPAGAVTSFARAAEAAAIISVQIHAHSRARRDAAIAFSQLYGWRAHAERTLTLYASLLTERASPAAAIA